MPSSISSETSIISGVEFEQGGGREQQETEQSSNLKKEMGELRKGLQKANLKNVNLEKEMGALKDQFNELKNDKIAQSNRLAQLEMNDRARRVSSTLPPHNSDGKIELQGHKYSPDFVAFIHNGDTYCRDFAIQRGPNDIAFHGYPPEFFNELIKHIHETEKPDEMVANLDIALALNNPAPWPTVLVQLHAADLGWISKEQDGMPTLTEEKVDYRENMVQYTMSNKHKSEARFKLCIYFEGGAKCYKQMTRFAACRIYISTFAGSDSEEGEEEETERKLEAELEKANAKNEELEKEVKALKDQQMIDQIVIGYARTLPAPDFIGDIHFMNGRQYTPDMDIFVRYGAAHCRGFFIWHETDENGFFGYPASFFDDLILYYYETKVPTKAVHYLRTAFPLENPAPWPAALVQPHEGEMNVEELKVCNALKYVEYILHNKNNPNIKFKLLIHYAKCYQQMTCFGMEMAGAQSDET